MGMVLRRKLPLAFWRRLVGDIEAIVPVYQRMNKIMSFGFDDDVRRTGISLLDVCDVCLDVGAGPGDSLLIIVGESRCSYVIGLEPSHNLARIAKERCALCDVVVALAEYPPFRQGSVDCITAFFSTRDFMDLELSMVNLALIARKQIVVGDVFLVGNRLLRLLQRVWVCILVPVIAAIIAGRLWRSYLSLCRTLKGWLTPLQLSEAMKSKGLTGLKIVEFAFGGLAVVAAWKSSDSRNGC